MQRLILRVATWRHRPRNACRQVPWRLHAACRFSSHSAFRIWKWWRSPHPFPDLKSARAASTTRRIESMTTSGRRVDPVPRAFDDEQVAPERELRMRHLHFPPRCARARGWGSGAPCWGETRFPWSTDHSVSWAVRRARRSIMLMQPGATVLPRAARDRPVPGDAPAQSRPSGACERHSLSTARASWGGSLPARRTRRRTTSYRRLAAGVARTHSRSAHPARTHGGRSLQNGRRK